MKGPSTCNPGLKAPFTMAHIHDADRVAPTSKLYSGWMNVYRSGWFHRQGKPGDVNRHGGDLYMSLQEAMSQIDPVSHYVATVPVQWHDEPGLEPNGPDSEPLPLRATRRAALDAQPALGTVVFGQMPSRQAVRADAIRRYWDATMPSEANKPAVYVPESGMSHAKAWGPYQGAASIVLDRPADDAPLETAEEKLWVHA